MNGYEYRDVNYPEEKYEDKEFTEDELYDAIAYAFNDGYYGAVNKAYEWVRENWRNYINVDKDGMICFGHWEHDFRKAMEN